MSTNSVLNFGKITSTGIRLVAVGIMAGGLLGCGGETTSDTTASSDAPANAGENSPLFTLLEAEQTGIDFENKLVENVNTDQNVLSYQYFFNGGGVAIGDVNNDGLEDVFFTANSQPNRLYINKGNLQFEDVSEKAGLTANKWSTGASIIDVDGDGWKDIYVCNGGVTKNAADRQNWLYMNNGDGTFTEKGKELGVNDNNRSTQASFFDYDKDGDLDLFVMNHADYFRVPLKIVFEDLKKPEKLALASSNLYRNDNGTYKKVTKEAGLLNYGYGLGLVTVDINNDGYTDIYQANDYSVPDFMYINQGDGTFKEELKQHTRQAAWFGMGADIADFNNDGHADIGVVDMAADDHVRGKTLMLSMDSRQFWTYVEYLQYQYQYMFNSLQLNNGDGSFSNISHMAGIAATDWSWTSLFCDLDNDGLKDYIVTNGYRRYALDNDFKIEMEKVRQANKGSVPPELREQMYAKMPQIPLPNSIFHNQGDLTFSKVSEAWGMGQKSYSNGAAVADLDQDGDLDFVVSNIDAAAFVYRNNAVEQQKNNWLRVQLDGTEPQILGATVELRYNGQKQVQELMPVRGFQSSHGFVLHFGLGQQQTVDSVIVRFPAGTAVVKTAVKGNQVLTVAHSEATGVFNAPAPNTFMARVDPDKLGIKYRHKENRFDDFATEVLLPHRQSALGPFISVGDANNDGLDDFFVGGALGQPGKLFVQTATGFAQQDGPWVADQQCEDMDSHFFDADGDGDQDLYVVSGGTERGANHPTLQDRLYINNNGNFTRSEGLPPMFTSGLHVSSADVDGDGDLDLFVGGRIVPGKYPYPPDSYLLQNDGHGTFTDVTESAAPDLRNIGLINDAVWTDIDADNDADLIVAGEWTAIEVFRNNEGSFERATADLGFENFTGWWYSLTEADIDSDGDMDLVCGNLGLNNKFHASEKKPLHVYSDDMDENQTCDIVLSKYYKGNLVPVRGRECSSEQMPFITEKFPTYNDFAHAKLDEIYTPEKLQEALHYQVNDFRSLVLVNNGSGQYKPQYLPNRAQVSPINGALVWDCDRDGRNELLIAGNMYGAEVETPKYDAGAGLILECDAQANFSARAPYQTGFSLPYDVKDIALVRFGTGDSKLLLATANNMPLLVFGLVDPANPRQVLLSQKD